MKAIFYVIKNNCSWSLLNDIRGFTLYYTNYFRFFKKLTDSNIFSLVYRDLVKYKFKDINLYNDIFSIDSTIVINNCGNDKEKISKIPQYSKKKGSKISVIINNETLIPV